jgi:hypothetical protein
VMKNQDDSIPEGLRKAAREYHTPPELTRAQLDEMWTSIESEAFDAEGDGRKAESAVTPIRVRWFAAQRLLPIAATLILGVAIGRLSAGNGQDGLPSVPGAPAVALSDSLGLPEPYQSTTSRYLGQATALLAALPAEVRAGRSNEPYLGRAHDLLLTTRLLLDSPAAADPRFRNLLEDLELVLAQVVRLQSVESAAELDLIRQALEQRDVLPRLRTAVADMSADD